MKIFALIGLVLAALTVSLAAPANVAGQDNPNVIFNRCTQRLQQISERTTNAQREIVRECVPVIEELLMNGEFLRARAVAERCINRINEVTEDGLRALHATCEECIQALRRLEAYALANRLEQICQEHAARIRNSRERAVNRIRSLFGD